MVNSEHFTKAVVFGKLLIKTEDLDPMYTAVYGAKLSQDERARLALAYSCLYHLGASAMIAALSGSRFWDTLEAAAANVGLVWPRGSERRHWRGAAAVKSAAWLRANYKRPEDVIRGWSGESFGAVAECVKQAPSFGPWIAFKLADVMERLMEVPVNFDNCELGIYKDPRMGAALLLKGDQQATITDLELGEVATSLRKALGKLTAPPSHNRIINVQEIETVLCKYKSHVNGHYPPGKDTLEVHAGLSEHNWGPLASRMASALEPFTKRWL